MSHSVSINKLSVTSKLVSELAFLFTVYILVNALLFIHFRAWDADIIRQVAGIAVYPVVLCGGVALAWQYVNQVLWILPIGCLVFMSLPFVLSFLGGWSLIPLGLLGVSAVIWGYISSAQKQPLNKVSQLIATGAILSIIYFVLASGYVYADAVSDVLTYTNYLDTDILFHSAFVEMLAKFNIPSTGLDGVRSFSYHVWVHRWMAANLNLLGGSAPMLLTFSIQLAFLPALFFTSVLVLMCLASTPISVIMACGWTFVALWILGAYIWDFYLVAHSYTLSLPIFVAMLPVGKSWLCKAAESNRWFTVHPVALGLAVVTVIISASTKISTGVILALFLILCAFSPKIWQGQRLNWRGIRPILVSGLVFVSVALLLGWHFNRSMYGSISFYPFHYAREFPSQFIAQNLVGALLMVVFYFLSRQSEQLHLSQLTMLIVILLGSQVPGVLLEILGGSANYFVHPAILIILFFTLALTADYWQENHKTGLVGILDPVKGSYKSPSPLFSWGLVILIIIHSSQIAPENFPTYKDRALVLFERLSTTIDVFSAQSETEYSQRVRKQRTFFDRLGVLVSPQPINQNLLQDTTTLGFIQRVISDSKISPNYINSPTKSAIYISPAFFDFWRPQGRRSCWEQSFVIPAMTGFPLIAGIRNRNNGCIPRPDYTMKLYSSESWNRVLSDSELCHRASELGFTQVLNITDKTRYNLLTCPVNTPNK